jgi:hypothetical protein
MNDIIEIDKNIIVYKGLFPQPDVLSQILIDSENSERKEGDIFQKWESWYTFGTQMSFPWLPDISYQEMMDTPNTFRNRELLKGDDRQKWVAESISNAFYLSTLDYIKKNKVSFPNWSKMGLTICKYNKSTTDYAMAYHTDFTPFKEDHPGYKFGLTCTIYLNDDYEGGEISFLNIDSKKVIEYKPYAGDVIVFPSGEPYYHGVNRVGSGSKYFIRLFWGWNSDGTDSWHKGVEKYGEDEWNKMETARFKQEIWDGMWHKDVVWDEKELLDSKYQFSEESPRITPIYSPHKKIKLGRGNDL